MKKLIRSAVFLILTLLFFYYQWDTDAMAFIASFRTPVLTAIMHFFSFLGSVWVMVPIGAFFLFSRKHGDKKVALGTLLAFLVAHGLKLLIQRERPSADPLAIETTYSFPSAHTLANDTFYNLLGIGAPWMRILISYIIAFSRVYLGVHYPTDVFGAFAMSSLILLAFEKKDYLKKLVGFSR